MQKKKHWSNQSDKGSWTENEEEIKKLIIIWDNSA